MSSSSLLDIQECIYNKLVNDSNLMDLVSGVFDDVPKEQSYPFIHIGLASENNFHCFDKSGRDVIEEIYIYSQYNGLKEGLVILNSIVEILDFSNLNIDNFGLVYCRYEGSDTDIRNIDNGRTKQFSLKFRIIVQEV